MVLSQRKEFFRYNFHKPLFAEFCVLKLSQNEEEAPVKSSIGDAKIIDISPGGMKIITVFELPVAVHLDLYFSIYSFPFEVQGIVMWKKKESNIYLYGLQLIASPETRQKIIDELKIYSKENSKK